MTRNLIIITVASAALNGCAWLQQEPADNDYVCKPGTGVKIQVDNARAYPRDMRWEGGSCARQGVAR